MADLKLDTLIKVLLMTTSDTDGEALAAIRRANSMLKNAATSWDDLLRGKVTVMADPFENISAPHNHASSRPVQKPAAPPPPPPPPSQYLDCDDCGRTVPRFSVKSIGLSGNLCTTCYADRLTKAAQRPKPQPAPQNPSYFGSRPPRSTRNTNSFSGHCFACNCQVDAGYGALRDVNAKLVDNSYAQTKIFCEDCNQMLTDGRMTLASAIDRANKRILATRPKPAPRTKRKVTTADLMSDIFNDPFDT